SGANSSSYTIAAVTSADNGAQFRCVVSNTAGSATSNSATLTVPGTVTVTLTSSPGGLQLTLDGRTVTAPYSFVDAIGVAHTIGAPSPQHTRGKNYDFLSWSDGGAQTHSISTPSVNTTYTATYQRPK